MAWGHAKSARMARFEIRSAGPEDEDPLFELARHLNTVNLPNDRGYVRALLESSARSFSGEEEDAARRRYVFVLWDTELGRAAGSSSIIGQLGRRDAPYIYFDVLKEEKYSRTIDAHFEHTLLRLGFSYSGPTELGGLVVHPDYRRMPERLGRMISYVRFLFIAARREAFRAELLAELLPPLEPDGGSLLWNALGRRFTRMTYAEADLLSSQNKDFIHDLFPGTVIYATLFDDAAQSLIGRVGAQTRGVEKMLRRIGFEYAERIDPFDGGPHFVARTDDVTLVKQTRRVHYRGAPEGGATGTALVACEAAAPPHFLAICPEVELGEGGVRLPARAAERLGLSDGQEVLVLPLRGPTGNGG